MNRQWPVAARLLAGRYEQADIDEVRLRDPGLSYHDVTFTAARIDIGPMGGLLGDDIRIHDGTATATLRFDAIESVLSANGVTAELSEQAGSVRAEVLVPPFGEVPTTVHVAAAGGGVEMQFVPLDLVALLPLRVDLPLPPQSGPCTWTTTACTSTRRSTASSAPTNSPARCDEVGGCVALLGVARHDGQGSGVARRTDGAGQRRERT